MNPNVPTFDRATTVDAIYPDSYAVGTVTGDWIDASAFHSFMATVMSGITVGGEIDFKIEQATDGTGTGAKDVTGAAVTQITAASRVSQISLIHDNLDIANDFRYIRISLTVATAASEAAALLQGFNARYEPAPVEANVEEVAVI